MMEMPILPQKPQTHTEAWVCVVTGAMTLLIGIGFLVAARKPKSQVIQQPVHSVK